VAEDSIVLSDLTFVAVVRAVVAFIAASLMFGVVSLLAVFRLVISNLHRLLFLGVCDVVVAACGV